MMNNKKPEVWLRGELPGISTLLQPAAHALLQSKEEVFKYTEGFPEFLLWKPVLDFIYNISPEF